MRSTTRPGLAALALAAILAVGACETSVPSTTPAPTVNVLLEISEVNRLLDESLAAYRAGNAVEAERLAGDAYLEHFEYVEDPLGEKDHDLMESIEHLIRDDLRAAIRDGKPVAEIEAMITKAKADLATGEALLR
jgi:hypothetical protein